MSLIAFSYFFICIMQIIYSKCVDGNSHFVYLWKANLPSSCNPDSVFYNVENCLNTNVIYNQIPLSLPDDKCFDINH